MLNCKQGDLAIIVSSCIPNSPNIGKVVRCLEFVPAGHVFKHDGQGYRTITDGWRVDGHVMRINLVTGEQFPHDTVEDRRLKPLRDNEEDDETLAWAGKPEKLQLTGTK